MKVCLACSHRFNDGWTCPRCGEAPGGNGRLLFPLFRDDVGDAFPTDAATTLELVEAGSFWFRSRNELLLWAVQRYFPSAQSFLELGCGTGFVLSGFREHMPGLRLEGGELDPQSLDVAHGRLPGVPIHRLDARRVPFDSEFDLVGAFDVIEHVDEDVLVLEQMAQAVKPGGGVLITVPQHPSLWSVADEVGHHRRRYTRAELVSKMRAAGLEPLRVTSFVTCLLPVMFATRRRERTHHDAARECTLPSVVDRWFEWTMTVERRLIRLGVSLPLGGSLLAVATR